MSSMSVVVYFAGSCAVSAIQNLGSMDNARHAMHQFCKAELVTPKSGFGSNLSEKFRKLASHYAFVAGPEVPKDHPNGSHHSKEWVKYGTEFAAFILENKLGMIGTTAPVFNLKHHAHTTCQVWIWTPDVEALKAWWTTNEG